MILYRSALTRNLASKYWQRIKIRNLSLLWKLLPYVSKMFLFFFVGSRLKYDPLSNIVRFYRTPSTPSVGRNLWTASNLRTVETSQDTFSLKMLSRLYKKDFIFLISSHLPFNLVTYELCCTLRLFAHFYYLHYLDHHFWYDCSSVLYMLLVLI